MAPLIVQLVAWAGFWLAGIIGLVPAAATPAGALRFALTVMFGFTALSHFLPRTRADLVRMVPPALPAPGFLVSLTGGLELAGAIGLLLPPLTRLAALALALLLVALFPANVHSDRVGLQVAGRRATPLRYRLPLQLFWIVCLLWVAVTHPATGSVRIGATDVSSQLMDRWWVFGGVGLAVDGPAFNDIKAASERRFEVGAAAVVGTGYDLWRHGRIAWDVQARAQHGRTATGTPDKRRGQAGTLLLGVFAL